jgi:hypothetical protein
LQSALVKAHGKPEWFDLKINHPLFGSEVSL